MASFGRTDFIMRAKRELADGIASRCACGDYLGHRLIKVGWFAEAVDEICEDCGAVDFEWVSEIRCTKNG